MDCFRSHLYSHLGMDMDSNGIMMETRNFSYAELKCKCGCEGNEMKPEFLNKLQAIRDEFQKPIRINSGFRCSNHDANVSSSKIAGKGPHTTGHAVDVGISGADALHLVELAVKNGMTGIGIKQKGKGRFIHVDDLTEDAGPRPWIWSY